MENKEHDSDKSIDPAPDPEPPPSQELEPSHPSIHSTKPFTNEEDQWLDDVLHSTHQPSSQPTIHMMRHKSSNMRKNTAISTSTWADSDFRLLHNNNNKWTIRDNNTPPIPDDNTNYDQLDLSHGTHPSHQRIHYYT